MTVKGTIKSVNSYKLNIYGIELNTYYMAHVDTSLGGLDIIIYHNVLPENIEGFGEGNIIVAEMLLSRDVWINEYDKYIRKNNTV